MNKLSKKNINELQKILPYQIDFYLAEFKNTCIKINLTAFSSEIITTESWFKIFKDQILEAIDNKKFLPVCRFNDGELIFMNNGLDVIGYGFSLKSRVKILVRNFLIRSNLLSFSPLTFNKYTSGKYSYKEIKSVNSKYKQNIKFILENGILATSMLVDKKPFSERFFKLFTDFITNNKIKLTILNHVPYQFVYVLFSGKSKFEILKNKNVLIINSFNVDQKRKVTKKLKSFGAKKIFYTNISSNRSVFDKLNISVDVDLILIGAGVGKLFHFEYLSKFKVPCIDIGYIFQTWIDPNCASHRSFCSPEDIYNIELDK